MTELREGERVVVSDPDAALHGLVGIVRRVQLDGTSPGAETVYWVEVPGDTARGYAQQGLHWFLPHQLERAPA